VLSQRYLHRYSLISCPKEHTHSAHVESRPRWAHSPADDDDGPSSRADDAAFFFFADTAAAAVKSWAHYHKQGGGKGGGARGHGKKRKSEKVFLDIKNKNARVDLFPKVISKWPCWFKALSQEEIKKLGGKYWT